MGSGRVPELAVKVFGAGCSNRFWNRSQGARCNDRLLEQGVAIGSGRVLEQGLSIISGTVLEQGSGVGCSKQFSKGPRTGCSSGFWMAQGKATAS